MVLQKLAHVVSGPKGANNGIDYIFGFKYVWDLNECQYKNN
jgi:hypothetical protein